jgi:coiled-coil domain-containing protein 12
MEEAARARAEKLKALREKSQSASGSKEEGGKPTLKFRNYQPKTADLKEAVLPPAVAPDAFESVPTEKEEVRLDVAPKKPNWDLKRDITKKLEKLERRTQQAIVEMIREQVANSESANEADRETAGKMLAQAVSSM